MITTRIDMEKYRDIRFHGSKLDSRLDRVLSSNNSQSYFPISCEWFLRVLLFPRPSVTILPLPPPFFSRAKPDLRYSFYPAQLFNNNPSTSRTSWAKHRFYEWKDRRWNFATFATINLGVKHYRDSKLRDRGGDRFDPFTTPLQTTADTVFFFFFLKNIIAHDWKDNFLRATCFYKHFQNVVFKFQYSKR